MIVWKWCITHENTSVLSHTQALLSYIGFGWLGCMPIFFSIFNCLLWVINLSVIWLVSLGRITKKGCDHVQSRTRHMVHYIADDVIPSDCSERSTKSCHVTIHTHRSTFSGQMTIATYNRNFAWLDRSGRAERFFCESSAWIKSYNSPFEHGTNLSSRTSQLWAQTSVQGH